MNYIILKCVEDNDSAEVTLYDVTGTLPECFNQANYSIAREYEHLNLSDGTKYATKRIMETTVRFIAKPICDYVGCHILTIQK